MMPVAIRSCRIVGEVAIVERTRLLWLVLSVMILQRSSAGLHRSNIVVVVVSVLLDVAYLVVVSLLPAHLRLAVQFDADRIRFERSVSDDNERNFASEPLTQLVLIAVAVFVFQDQPELADLMVVSHECVVVRRRRRRRSSVCVSQSSFFLTDRFAIEIDIGDRRL
jgi:hypothetical protein